MVKKIVLLALFAGALVASFALAKHRGKALANTAINTPPTRAAQPAVTEKSEKPSALLENTATQNAYPQNPQRRIEQMLALMDENALKAFKGGWLHIHETIDFDIDVANNGVLPNGKAIPLHQINDIWYQINEDGKIVTTLTIMHTQDGDVVQVGRCKDGVSWNSATQTQEPCFPDTLHLDGGFQHEMKWQISKGAVVQQEGVITRPAAKSDAYQVVLTQHWSTPFYGDAYKKGITKAVEQALFDIQGGHLIEWQTTFHFEDGSERVYRRITWQVTAESPSSEAQEFLQATP